MTFQTSIEETIYMLEKRPFMLLIEDANYNSCRIFIEGYLWGLSAAFEVDLMWKITMWFRRQIGVDIDVHWTTFIPIHYADRSEEEWKSIMFRNMEKYFMEHPQWNLVALSSVANAKRIYE